MSQRVTFCREFKGLCPEGEAKASVNSAIERQEVDPKPSDPAMSRVNPGEIQREGPNPPVWQNWGMTCG